MGSPLETESEADGWEAPYPVRTYARLLGPGLFAGYFGSSSLSYFMGVSNSPSGSGLGAKLDGGLEALKSKAGRGGGMHFEAATFAACWSTYHVVKGSLARHRGKEDPLNSIMGLGAAAGLGLGILEIRHRPRLRLRVISFAVGAAFSAIAVGVTGLDYYERYFRKA